MIGGLLLFGSLAFVVLIPLIGDNPNDMLSEAGAPMTVRPSTPSPAAPSSRGRPSAWHLGPST